MAATHAPPPPRSGGLLGLLEHLGNKLPDPVFLFIGALVLVAMLSAAGAWMGWSVQPVRPRAVLDTVTTPAGGTVRQPRLDAAGAPVIEFERIGTPITPRNLVSGEGLYWLASNLVRNFINFAPLGIVLVSMLGIGVAEHVGLFAAAMRHLATIVPSRALTPMVLFLGMLSHLASDAGYIILPPLAAALFAAAGRPPLAGIATAFAGVAGGFSANLLIASTDALIAPLTERAARLLEPHYVVLPTANWYFMAASTVVLIATGWLITARLVEPRLAAAAPPNADLSQANHGITPIERRGLRIAALSVLITAAALAALVALPGAPLAGTMPAPAPAYGPIPLTPDPPRGEFSGAPVPGERSTPGSLTVRSGVTLDALDAQGARGVFRVTEPAPLVGVLDPAPAAGPRWSQAIVPFIFVCFVVPGIAYGVTTGAIRSHKDITKAFVQSMASMAPVVAMAFFAAQFVEAFRFSNLDAMIANAGGQALAAAALPKPLLLIAVILLVIVLDILIASMSAKWTAMAPILVPMLMMTGLSPELTQAAYRIGDSVVNVVTPLNSYIIVILAVVQRYRHDAGIGNLIALMLPYSVGFAIVWTLFLLAWAMLGLPLGPGAGLWYTPGAH